MPNVVAQMTEYAPKRIRATLVTLMFSGYAVGGIVAAILGKGLIETYGSAIGIPRSRAPSTPYTFHPEVASRIDAVPIGQGT